MNFSLIFGTNSACTSFELRLCKEDTRGWKGIKVETFGWSRTEKRACSFCEYTTCIEMNQLLVILKNESAPSKT
jgi:hypothetical protein